MNAAVTHPPGVPGPDIHAGCSSPVVREMKADRLGKSEMRQVIEGTEVVPGGACVDD